MKLKVEQKVQGKANAPLLLPGQRTARVIFTAVIVTLVGLALLMADAKDSSIAFSFS